MKLNRITVCQTQLLLELDTLFDGILTVEEYTPVVHGTPRLLSHQALVFEGGRARCPRLTASMTAPLAALSACRASSRCRVSAM